MAVKKVANTAVNIKLLLAVGNPSNNAAMALKDRIVIPCIFFEFFGDLVISRLKINILKTW